MSIVILFPLIILGIIIGERLHSLIDEYACTILVFVLLLGAGLSIVL